MRKIDILELAKSKQATSSENTSDDEEDVYSQKKRRSNERFFNLHSQQPVNHTFKFISYL